MYKILFPLILFTVLFASCTKQTDAEAREVKPLLQRSDKYYENLRAYKNSDHQVYFGWFGATGGSGSATFAGLWDQIPDSVDIVSCWGGVPEYGSPNFQAMQRIRTLKGTRVVMVFFSDNYFLQYFGGEDFLTKYTNQGDSLLKVGFAKIARSMSDSVTKYQMDGFDFDHEPSGLLRDDYTYGLLINEVSKYFGPKSGTDRLLIIDGFVGLLPDEYADRISYGVQQLYGVTTPSLLEDYFYSSSRKPKSLPENKVIICESFEAFAGIGGANFSDPLRGRIRSMQGYAYWQPSGGRKGGCGSYHTEYDYVTAPIDYRFVREAIQIMNPAAK